MAAAQKTKFRPIHFSSNVLKSNDNRFVMVGRMET